MSHTKLQQTQQQTAATWDVDPAHSIAEFRVKHLMIATVTGTMRVAGGTIRYDPARPEDAVVEATLEAASIDTRATDRDAHLRSPDFIDAEGHPTLAFRGTRVEPAGDGFRVEGDLTIRGVTRPVTLEVEHEGEARDPWGKTRAALTATTTLDRSEWGLTWNQALEAGGVLVGDKVKVTLRVQAVRRD